MVATALDRLSGQPERYPQVLAGVRRIVLARFPYSLFYRVRPEAIEILAVFHHRRDPVVWHRRAAP
jgi:plasmid stabilization system protein ParE